MNAPETWAPVFAWCTLINGGLLIFAVIFMATARGAMSKLHARMFGIPEADLPVIYFRYLAGFKLLFIVFNLVPYIALRIVL